MSPTDSPKEKLCTHCGQHIPVADYNCSKCQRAEFQPLPVSHVGQPTESHLGHQQTNDSSPSEHLITQPITTQPIKPGFNARKRLLDLLMIIAFLVSLYFMALSMNPIFPEKQVFIIAYVFGITTLCFIISNNPFKLLMTIIFPISVYFMVLPTNPFFADEQVFAFASIFAFVTFCYILFQYLLRNNSTRAVHSCL